MGGVGEWSSPVQCVQLEGPEESLTVWCREGREEKVAKGGWSRPDRRYWGKEEEEEVQIHVVGGQSNMQVAYGLKGWEKANKGGYDL